MRLSKSKHREDMELEFTKTEVLCPKGPGFPPKFLVMEIISWEKNQGMQKIIVYKNPEVREMRIG